MTVAAALRRWTAPSFQKKAGPPSQPGSDTTFEQSFADLAFAILREKVAALSGKEIGFQMIDKNEEGDRAIGVVGYRLGKQLAYVPVVFDDAVVKGAELLYLPAEDVFLHNSEEWVNELQSKTGNDLGRAVRRYNIRRRSQPALWQLKYTPEKTAEATDRLVKIAALAEERGHPLAPWSVPFVESMSTYINASPEEMLGEKTAGGEQDEDKAASLPELLEMAPLSAVRSYLQFLSDHPIVAEKVAEWYPPEQLQAAVLKSRERAEAKQAAVRPPRPLVTPPGRDRIVITADRLFSIKAGSVARKLLEDSLTTEERQEITHGGMVVKRTAQPVKGMPPGFTEHDKVSKGYRVRDAVNHLINPNTSGIYDLVTTPGKMVRCFVAIAPARAAEHARHCIVVKLDSKHWLATHQSRVWTDGLTQMSELHKFLDDLPPASSLVGKPLRDGVYMLVGNQGAATLPFKILREHGGKDFTAFDVKFITDAETPFPDHAPGRLYERDRRMSAKDVSMSAHRGLLDDDEPVTLHHFDVDANLPGSRATRIVLTGTHGVKMRMTGDSLQVPDSFKLLTLKGKESGTAGSDEPPILTIDDIADFHVGMLRHGGMGEMKISRDNRGYTVEVRLPDPNAPHPSDPLAKAAYLAVKTAKYFFRNATECATYLIEEHGLAKEAAQSFVSDVPLGPYDLTTMTKVGAHRIFIKYAGPFPGPQNEGPNAPDYPEAYYGPDPLAGMYTAQYQQEMGVPIADAFPDPSNREAYRAVNFIQPNTVGGGQLGYDLPALAGQSGGGGDTEGKDDEETKQLAERAARSGSKNVMDASAIGQLARATQTDALTGRSFVGSAMEGVDKMSRALVNAYYNRDRWEEKFGEAEYNDLTGLMKDAVELNSKIVLRLKEQQPGITMQHTGVLPVLSASTTGDN